MLSRVSATLLRQAARPRVFRPSSTPSLMAIRRPMTTVEEVMTADDALKKSGYSQIDYTILDSTTVYDAVQKFAAFNIGCLVTVDEKGNMTGIVSERDYVCKIALLGRTSKETQVKEISTKSANLATAKLQDSVEDCMQKMLTKDVRHLPLVDEAGSVVGMISIKDLVKTLVQEKEKTIQVLSNFALGKGGYFGSE